MSHKCFISFCNRTGWAWLDCMLVGSRIGWDSVFRFVVPNRCGFSACFEFCCSDCHLPVQ